MVLSACLRRMMGRSRRVFLSRLETYNTYNYNYNYNCNSEAISIISHGTWKISRFISFDSQTNFTAKQDFEKDREIEKGDIVNLSQLLFTTNRDYLIKYSDPQLVTADKLAGKIIVIYFVPLHCPVACEDKNHRKTLMDTYNDLKSNNCFEVVLVVVDDATGFDEEPGKLCFDPSLQGKFEDICSETPSWPAIPFSDITSRQRLKKKFGFFFKLYDTPQVVLIDSKGMVLDTSSQKLFQAYGSEAYPFSDERISFLKSIDKTSFSGPSLKALLGTSDRDFVISNKGEKVPIYTLENKVVALFFYEDSYTPDFFTRKLEMYYEELKKNDQNFEVVLLYLTDTDLTISSTNEETFHKTFDTMPWLALPYKDPAHKKLRRLFGYPYEQEAEIIIVPTLVIVGPCTDIIQPGVATNLRGYDANLFMREGLAKVEGERVWELKLEMLCSRDTVFKRKDGYQVQFSQLAGKQVIFYFEGDHPEYDGLWFKENLKEKYTHMKGTADEFEVIYFPNSKDKNGKRVADFPWLVSCPVESLHGCSAFLSFCGKSCNRYQSSFLLAFSRDGSIVRRTICPQFRDTYFPFFADDVEPEASDIRFSNFCWGYWDTLYKGLLSRTQLQINFIGGDLLFCVHCNLWDQ